MTSRPFSSNTFTLEIRLKMSSGEAWSAVVGDGSGGSNNKLVLYHNNSTSALEVQFGTGTDNYSWDLGNTVNMSVYHTFKFTQANGVLKFYLDDIQKGSNNASNGTLTVSLIGMGAASQTFDMSGVIDFFRIKNTVDDAPLPVKFKSFKATNVK